MIAYVIFVPIGYLIGSLPIGLIVGRIFKRVDVRQLGTGKTGMTNVMRTVGVKAGLLVLLLDMGKSVAAIAIARAWSESAGVDVGAGLAVIVGHVWPVFFGFKGGRGTAPGWAGLFMLSPISGAVATLVGSAAVGGSRYISLGSLVAAITGAATLIVLAATGSEPVTHIWYGIGGASFLVFMHRDNIQRLLSGREPKIGQTAAHADSEPDTRRRGRGLRWSRSP